MAKAAKKTAKPKSDDPSVVVIGDHPAAHVAALKLHQQKASVALADPQSIVNGDRLVHLNPDLFKLLPSLKDLAVHLDATELLAVRFHGEGGSVADTTATFEKEASPLVVRLDALRNALRRHVDEAGIPRTSGKVAVGAVDESGVTLQLGRSAVKPRLVLVSDPLDDTSRDVLQAQRPTPRDVMATAAVEAPEDATQAHAGLGLAGGDGWGTLIAHAGVGQITVFAPAAKAGEALSDFTERLVLGGVLPRGTSIDGRTVRTTPVALGGALERDAVARHTLLIGPAGGFESIIGEDVYPGAWSGVYAGTVAAKAAKAEHVQDALAAYRTAWGGTLGEYLQGPRQNLRFLLPLVFKNPVMTDRMADALFRGRSLVR